MTTEKNAVTAITQIATAVMEIVSMTRQLNTTTHLSIKAGWFGKMVLK